MATQRTAKHAITEEPGPERARPHQVNLYIHAAHRTTWAEAEKIAERLYGPRQLSRYVSEALAERNAREHAR